MDKARMTCAIWPWGEKSREQLRQAFKDISEIGYTSFETGNHALDMFEGNAPEFESIVEEYGLKPASFFFAMSGDDEADMSNLYKKMEFIEKLDVHRISLQAPLITGRKPTREELAHVLENIIKTGKVTREYGVLPCFHPHHNTMVMYEDEIDFVMQNTDPEYIAFGPDTAHLTISRCDPAEVMGRYADRIRFLHLKDFKKGETIQSKGMGSGGYEIYKNFRELGEGSIDFVPVFKVLKDVKYDGFMCTELDTSRFNNRTSAEMNFRYMMEKY